MKLNLLFGAGSTIGVGLPTTAEITAHLERIGMEASNSYLKNRTFFSHLKDLLMRRGNFEDVHFELMLYAMEVIFPLLPQKEHFRVPDYFRSVLPAFVDLTEEAQRMEELGSISSWRGIAFRSISTLISERIATSLDKERHLADFLFVLSKQFKLRVFTLNYDDLVDRVDLSWRDGFLPNNSSFYQVFDAKQFIEEDKNSEALLVHLHGSTRFGYAQDGIFEIHNYSSPERAIHFLDDKGFSQNVHGRQILSGPMISGLSKIEQLMFRPCPYGYYFNSFMQNLITNNRLLILGYGGWDRHINEWILQFMQVHGSAARIAHIGPCQNKDLLTAIANNSLQPVKLTDTFHYYGDNVVFEPAVFPFADAETLDTIVRFLAS